MASTDQNNGSNAVRTLTDETQIPNTATPSSTAVPVTGGVDATEESVSGIGINTSTVQPPVIDYSLTAGLNIDSFFDLGGQATSTLGDLSGDLSGFLSNNFSLDDIVDQFGIGGLLGNSPISINTNVAPKLEPTQNVLHNYASFTYRLTMGAQDIKDHQATASEDFIIGTPKITTMMMASAGGQEVDGVTRDPIFQEDFYLEDLKMTTIIGATAQNNGSNAVNLTFTIMEPYAVSLIERLLALADKLGYKNYIEIPYVFKIEFIGYNDAGEMIGIIPQTTKYIPFRLTYMKFQVSGQGSLYQCTAIPVNHMTFNQTVEAIPIGIEVTAGNIGEFFNSKTTGDQGNNTTGGLVETVNEFYAELAAKTRGSSSRNAADRIKIVIDPAIAKHHLQVANLANVGMLKEGAGPNTPADPTKPKYGFLAGTAINAIIRDMIKNSTFWTNQIEENKKITDANAQLSASDSARAKSTNPLIKPQITARYKMLEYDEKANRHAYEATYIVEPSETAGQQSANIGRSEIENIAKEYDYLFTGKNQDILDLNIKFDLAFYNSAVSNTESSADGSPTGNNKAVTGGDLGDNLTNNSDPTMMAEVNHRPAGAIENIGTAAKEDIKKLKASALEKSIMQSSAGDMITLDLTILGDPDFIKQDDILYRSDGDNSNPRTSNGSIKQDSGDMYIRLRFKTFDDIDHDTGLRVEGRQIPNSSFTRKSTFDGFYRILMLNNIFAKGRFTQELVVVRTYVQETDKPESDAATNSTSNLVSFEENPRDNLINGVNTVIDGITLTAAAQVDEAQALSGDFFANQTPIDAGEFASVDETLITNLSVTPTASSIVDITNASPRRGGR